MLDENDLRLIEEIVLRVVRDQISASRARREKNPADLSTENGVARIAWNEQRGEFTGITDERLAEWRGAYPDLDVTLSLKRAAQWMAANPARRKKNVERFLVNWLASDARRAKPAPAPSPSAPSAAAPSAPQRPAPLCSVDGCERPASCMKRTAHGLRNVCQEHYDFVSYWYPAPCPGSQSRSRAQ